MGLVCVVNFFPVVTIAGVSTSARKSTMIFPLVDYLDLKDVVEEVDRLSNLVSFYHQRLTNGFLRGSWVVSCLRPPESSWGLPYSHGVDNAFQEFTLFDSKCTFTWVQLHFDPSDVLECLNDFASIKHLYLKSAKDSTFQLIGGVAYWLRHRICSASSLGTPIMSKGFQAKISRVDDDLLLLERVTLNIFSRDIPYIAFLHSCC
ncbi:hypothetical protein Tco_0716062 [Tanacetum coccineum]